MPITDRELEQIKIAIQAMVCLDVMGYGKMVNRNNVLVILSRWREEKEPKTEEELMSEDGR